MSTAIAPVGAEVAFRRRKSVRAEIFVKSTDATSCAGDVEERNVKIAKTKVKYLNDPGARLHSHLPRGWAN